MSRLKSRLLVGGALGAAALGLAACGGDDNTASTGGSTATPPPVTQPPRFALFGTAFASAFDASATTEAREPAAGDVPALTLTAEPAEVA